MMKRREFGAALGLLALGSIGLSACTASGDQTGSGGSGTSGGTQSAATTGTDLNSLMSYNPQEPDALDDGGTIQLSLNGLGENFNTFCNAGNDVDSAALFYPMHSAAVWTLTAEGEYVLDENYCLDAKDAMVDGKQVITYTLNPKAVWNDGTPIDYKTFENMAAVLSGKDEAYSLPSSAGYEDIESVAKGKDDFEVVVTMAKVYEPYQELFTQAGSSTGPALLHPAVNTPALFNEGFVNDMKMDWRAGPFILDNFDKTAQVITLKRNDKWWGDAPKLEKIVFRAMPSSAVQTAFNNGQIDLASVSTKARRDQVKLNDATDEIRKGQNLSVFGRLFNSKSEALTDAAVRKAIFQATDRAGLVKVQYNGVDWTEPLPKSWYQMGFLEGVTDNYPAQFDQAAAKKTLEDAGYALGSDGFYAKDGKQAGFKLAIYNDDATNAAVNQAWQQQLKQAGINMVFDNRNPDNFGTDLEAGQFDAVNIGYSQGADPGSAPKQYLLSTGEGNYTGGGDAELDKRILEVNSIADKAERIAAANQLEKEWGAKYFGYMAIQNGPNFVAIRKGLANYGPKLFLTTDWTKVGWMKGTKQD
ncbi:ABC transporter family substrate-binding protein [Micrococcales bacterium 31B]|nr:ABC transporter family substrate-binding protein [Micrococcales bacterium 31B]